MILFCKQRALLALAFVLGIGAVTATEQHHVHARSLITKLHEQVETLQSLQRSIQKTIDDIKAVQVENGHATECPDKAYPLDPTSSFVSKDQIVTMNNGHAIRTDDILYGYDTFFESRRLFSAGAWLGVQCQQDPFDLVAIQQILWEVKPKVVLDIGTNVGGSAILFAHIVSQYAKPGEAVIVSVDPKHFDQNWDTEAKRLCPKCVPGAENALWGKYVQFVQSRAVEPPAVAALEAAIQKYGGPVLVSVDGFHEYDEVIEECNTFAKYVTKGSYMIVQDTKLDRLFGKAGPRQAVYDFLKANPDFAIDKAREAFLYSQHSDGYLRRER